MISIRSTRLKPWESVGCLHAVTQPLVDSGGQTRLAERCRRGQLLQLINTAKCSKVTIQKYDQISIGLKPLSSWSVCRAWMELLVFSNSSKSRFNGINKSDNTSTAESATVWIFLQGSFPDAPTTVKVGSETPVDSCYPPTSCKNSRGKNG